MRRSYLAFALFLLLSPAPASGQYAAVMEACSGDMKRFCAAGPGEGGLSACIEAHFQDFSTACVTALVRIDAVRDACRASIGAQCPAVRPGAGRIYLCVKKHFAKLSEACKTAIGEAAERNLRALERPPGARRSDL